LEVPNSQDDQNRRNLQPYTRSQGRRQQVKYSRTEEDSEVQSWEVVMEEKLATHEEEGEVVQKPAHEEKAAQSVIFDNFSCRK